MLFNVCALYIKIMNNENQTIHKSDDNLTIYGWNEKLNQLKQESIYSALAHGRVSIVHRTCYEVISGNGLFQAVHQALNQPVFFIQRAEPFRRLE